MGLNFLKSVSASLLLLLISTGCEDNSVIGPQNDPIHVTVTMPLIERIELNDYSWQTLMTIYGNLSSEDTDVEFMRVEWDSDMFWSIYDTTGYFRADCRGCESGTWYDSDGSIEPMQFDFHTMAPVTNQVSLADSGGDFGNVLAPVRSMVGKSMWLWWSINGTVIDSMSIFLME